jgi:hypothetical protein
LKVICENIVCFLCNCIYPEAASAFLVGSSVAGLVCQRFNADIVLSCTNQWYVLMPTILKAMATITTNIMFPEKPEFEKGVLAVCRDGYSHHICHIVSLFLFTVLATLFKCILH